MSKIVRWGRGLWRMLGFVTFTILWIISFWFARLGARDALSLGIRWRRKWLNVMFPFLGIRVHVTGRECILSTPAIYVSNHRSYIDPTVATTVADGVIVGKSEVASWPLIGTAAHIAGVIFVKREDKESRSATREKMEELLHKGFSILVYPEGTTTRAPEFLPFRPGAFGVAAALGVPIVPMVIEYADPDDAWIGDDTFVRHFFQTFCKRYVDVHLSIGTPIGDTDALVLLHAAHTWISDELKRLQGEKYITQVSVSKCSNAIFSLTETPVRMANGRAGRDH